MSDETNKTRLSAPKKKLRLAKHTIRDMNALDSVVGGKVTFTCDPDGDTRVIRTGSAYMCPRPF